MKKNLTKTTHTHSVECTTKNCKGLERQAIDRVENYAPTQPAYSTPWKLDINKNGNSGDWDYNIRTAGTVGKHVATVNPYLPDAEANAAFIVRAVNGFEALEAENRRLLNAHDDLVKALRQLANIVGKRGMDKTVVASLVVEAWQAIAAASKADGTEEVR